MNWLLFNYLLFRYIEIFRSTSAEVRRQNYNSRYDPYSRNDRGGGMGNRRNGDGGMKGGGNSWNMDDGSNFLLNFTIFMI